MHVCISNMYVCMHIKLILPTDKSQHVDHVHIKFTTDINLLLINQNT